MRVRRSALWLRITALPMAITVAGCQGHRAEHAANPALRHMESPPGGDKADADRATLARFVGVWTFDGWSTDPSGARNQAAGQAAGVIDNEHFVLLDLQVTSGQLSGRSGRKSGSMMFASEPGIGLTLSAWGDAAPSVSRFVGHVEGNGSAFVLDEARTPSGMHRLSAVMTFQTDDQWVAEIRDSSSADRPVVALYTFTRVSK